MRINVLDGSGGVDGKVTPRYLQRVVNRIVNYINSLFSDEAVFTGSVDFTDATVTGLSGGGDPLSAGSGIEIDSDTIHWDGPLSQDAEIDMGQYEVKFLRPGGSVITTGANLITNGDFASGITGWTGAISWDSGNQRAEIDNCDDSGCEGSFDFVVPETGDYLIEFEIQPGAIGSQYTDTGLSSEGVNSMYVVTNLTAGNETLRVANYYQPADQKMWIDNVSIRRVSAIVYDMQIGDNKLLSLPNGGFVFGTNPEAALLSNWGVGSSLASNTEGYQNTASGANALYSNTEGIRNTASGTNSLLNNTTGSYNTASGTGALFSNTGGFENTAIAHKALFSNTAGDANTAIGTGSLNRNTTGSRNTAIGVNANSDENFDNTTAIGYKAQPTADNQIVLGDENVTQLKAGTVALKLNQTIGEEQDGWVLTYNHSTGEIELQAP